MDQKIRLNPYRSHIYGYERSLHIHTAKFILPLVAVSV